MVLPFTSVLPVSQVLQRVPVEYSMHEAISKQFPVEAAQKAGTLGAYDQVSVNLTPSVDMPPVTYNTSFKDIVV